MKKKSIVAMAAMLLAGSLSFGVSCYAAGAEETKSGREVAEKSEMAAVEEVVEEGMTPVFGKEVKDGVYKVKVNSSSSMFKIEECELTVKDGEMTAVMTMGGTGYLKLFMGTGKEAAEASEKEWIPFEETEDGKHTFEVPVEALDQEIPCAAFSKKKEKWYERNLAFLSSSLPADALLQVEKTELSDLNLEDGIYQIEVSLEGGSGKTTVTSPTKIKIADGKAVAVVTFSSPYYDYMVVGEETYEPVNTEGNSSFEIPVDGFEWKMPVTADTIAMSTPHEIDYTLQFDSATIEKAES